MPQYSSGAFPAKQLLNASDREATRSAHAVIEQPLPTPSSRERLNQRPVGLRLRGWHDGAAIGSDDALAAAPPLEAHGDLHYQRAAGLVYMASLMLLSSPHSAAAQPRGSRVPRPDPHFDQSSLSRRRHTAGWGGQRPQARDAHECQVEPPSRAATGRVRALGVCSEVSTPPPPMYSELPEHP